MSAVFPGRWCVAVSLVATLSACNAAGGMANLPHTAADAIAASSAARERVLYAFRAGSDGSSPQGTLISDASGALYGTTAFGGSTGCFLGSGCGTVFRLVPAGRNYSESVLYSFSDGSDGYGPGSGVIFGAAGALYGTTEYGGDSGSDGTVFKLTPSGSKYVETVIYRFKGRRDGSGPLAGLTMDSAGDLYGATLLGGSGYGTVFELRPSGSGYTEHVLYRFQNGSDGATPGSPPILVGHDLYGTAATGGGNPACGGAPINPGCGTVYRLTPHGRRYGLRVIYRFTGTPNDAANAFAGLVVDKTGAFYGVGQYGGAQNEGAAFVLKRSGKGFAEHLLYRFTGNSDGSYPLATLALGKAGLLYGTTQYGGSPVNAGTVFNLQSSGIEHVLLAFQNVAGGEYPAGGILIGRRGVLYGTASYGGSASAAAGIAFRL